MTDDQRAAFEAELDTLRTVERPRLLALMGTVDGGDVADQAERAARELDLAQLEARIARLAARLAGAGLGGGAGAGGTAVLDFGDGPETFRLGGLDHGDGVPAITPDSPLAGALAGARPGATVTYRTPRGQASVTVVSLDSPLHRAA